MKEPAAFIAFIRTKHGLNNREHWSARARRVKRERLAIFTAFPREWLGEATVNPDARWVAHLIRGSPGTLDDDNLRGALKAVRDEVARLMGLDDRDPRIRWEYGQCRTSRGVYHVQVSLREDAHDEARP